MNGTTPTPARRREKRRRFHVRPEALGQGYYQYHSGCRTAPPVLPLFFRGRVAREENLQARLFRRVARNGMWFCGAALLALGGLTHLLWLFRVYLAVSHWSQRFG